MTLFFIISCTPKYQITNSNNNEELPRSIQFTELAEKTPSTIDQNNDGNPDQWKYSYPDSQAIEIRAVDLNHDGKEDIRTYFDPKGNITKEEFDGDFDGNVDIIDYYSNNKRVESHIDTNTDMTFDVFRFYNEGVLKREEIDTNYDNTIDVRYNYNADGRRIKE